MWPNPQESVDLVKFTEEILNGKLHFCAVCQLRALVLGHFYSVLYYQKPVVERTFPKKLMANLLWFLIVSHRVFLCFRFSFSRNLHDRTNIKFPDKSHSQIQRNNGILAQILEQRVWNKRPMSVVGAFPLASIVKINTLVLKSDSHLLKKLFYLLQWKPFKNDE